MQQLASLQSNIEEQLQQLHISNHPESLYEPLRYFLNIGGKRIRPILVLMAAKLFGNKNESVMNQALAVELFHNFTLIHDDIMDNAPLRRGVPTVHEKWNLSQGILSGDVLLIVAYQYLMRSNPEHLQDLFMSFNKMAVEVCEGQQMDMDFEKRNDVKLEEYIEMIRLKTSVLLGCALELGAIVSDASPDDRGKLYNFGLNIGIAFQIQDDILDVYADADKFGKQVGGDIISNKKTFLYLKARELADQNQQHIFEAQLHNSDTEEKVRIVRNLYDQLQVRHHAEEVMNHYYSLALENLNAIAVDHDMKLELSELADFLMNREL